MVYHYNHDKSPLPNPPRVSVTFSGGVRMTVRAYYSGGLYTVPASNDLPDSLCVDDFSVVLLFGSGDDGMCQLEVEHIVYTPNTPDIAGYMVKSPSVRALVYSGVLSEMELAQLSGAIDTAVDEMKLLLAGLVNT